MRNWVRNNSKIILNCVFGAVILAGMAYSCDRNADDAANIDAKQKDLKSQIDSVANLVQDVEAGVQENARAIQQVDAKVDGVQRAVNDIDVKLDTCCCKNCQKTSSNRQQKPAKPVVVHDTVLIEKEKVPDNYYVIYADSLALKCVDKYKVRER